MYRHVFKVHLLVNKADVRDELHKKTITIMTITCGIELKIILTIIKHRKI